MKLHEQLKIDLAAVDAALREVVESDPDLPRPSFIHDCIVQLIDAGGKRLRPMLAITGGRFGKPGHEERVRQAAALLEYIHMASLIHDDIIDRADLRRGRPTLHTATDIPTAVHVANYMMARAVEWASAPAGDRGAADDGAADEDAFRSAQIASIATDLCLGEYGQLGNRFNFDLTMAQYLDKTRRKTALLIAECLRAGAIAAGADERTADLLYRFGEALGIAFQIRDDALDFTASEDAIGKPAGADLRNGNITLPVLLALEDPALAPLIRSLHASSADEELQAVISRIQAGDAIRQTLALSRSYGEQALGLIPLLGSHDACGDLRIWARHFIGE